MATLKTSAVRAALTRKGFVQRDGDHHYYVYCAGGKKTAVFTKISHSADEISDTLIGAMARQTRLNKSQFCDLVKCTLSADEYKELLITSGHIKI